MSFGLEINGVVIECGDVEQIREEIDKSHFEQFREIWVTRGQASMCALASNDQAWLMMLRFPGDAGFSSRNGSFDGEGCDQMTFELANGQQDEYPKAWVLPPGIWVDAIAHFASTGGLSDQVNWHADG